jgi:hypothetical protein
MGYHSLSEIRKRNLLGGFIMKRWRNGVSGDVNEGNTTSDKNPNWVNELVDYYFPDKETIDLARGKSRHNFDIMTTSGPDLVRRGGVVGYVHEGNAVTNKSPNWVNELIDYYFPDKETIDLARGKTRITFKFWGLKQPSKKVFPRRLNSDKLIG